MTCAAWSSAWNSISPMPLVYCVKESLGMKTPLTEARERNKSVTCSSEVKGLRPLTHMMDDAVVENTIY